MQRVIAYIDGFNLYYGLRSKNWKRFYWLNIHEMVQRLLRPGQRLSATKYFTSIVNVPRDKQNRQAEFLEALGTVDGVRIYYGHYLWNTVVCSQCGHSYQLFHEKMTDVNIAVELLTDAYQDTFDCALLVSADSDLVAPIAAVKRLFPSKRVIAMFPPGRYSNALKLVADGYLTIGRNVLAQSVFADEIITATGHILHRPEQWH